MGLVPAGTRSRGHHTLDSFANPAQDLTQTRAEPIWRWNEAGIVISEMF